MRAATVPVSGVVIVDAPTPDRLTVWTLAAGDHGPAATGAWVVTDPDYATLRNLANSRVLVATPAGEAAVTRLAGTPLPVASWQQFAETARQETTRLRQAHLDAERQENEQRAGAGKPRVKWVSPAWPQFPDLPADATITDVLQVLGVGAPIKDSTDPDAVTALQWSRVCEVLWQRWVQLETERLARGHLADPPTARMFPPGWGQQQVVNLPAS